jgi:flagellar hook assembly protein FlgD
VRTVVEGSFSEGDHTAAWDGRDSQGHRVSPGTYFVRLQTGGESVTRKVVFRGE